MKYSTSIDINAPRERVVELFNNPDNLSKWQDGFKGVEQISGAPGTTGAKKKMFYEMNGREMELLETITANKLPDSFAALYQHTAMENTMTSRFIEINEGQGTRFEVDVEYTKFNGLMPKLMATFFPGVFRKQSQKWFEQFKQHAESDEN